MADAYAGSGIEPPRLCALHVRTETQVALWLEDIGVQSAITWSPDQFERGARQLGRAQGTFAAGRPLPLNVALSRGWLRAYISSKQADASLLQRQSPLPDGLRARLLRLWMERDRLLRILETLPRTFCHLDVWPKNLFGNDDRTVLVDWSFAGDGALGEDASNLILDSFFDGLVPIEQLPLIEEAVLCGYLAAAREAGWRGPEWELRLAVTAAAVKYCWLAPNMIASLHGRHTHAYDIRSAEESFLGRAPVLARACDWAEEALSR